MQHISLKLLKTISIFYSSHSVWLKAIVYTVLVTAQVTLVGTHYGLFFFYLPFLLVFNLHPQKHSKHLLDIERNGIYNADAEQTSLVQFETSFLTCKMLLDTSSFFCFFVFMFYSL